MPIPASERLTGQEDGAIAACINARREVQAHTERLTGALESVRLTLPSRPVLLALLEAYRDAVQERAQQISDICLLLRAPRLPGPH